MKKLLDVVGPAKAKEIFFTGDRIAAERAAELGLVNQVVPKHELDAHIEALALRIAVQAPVTLKAFKKMANQLLKASSEAQRPNVKRSSVCASRARTMRRGGAHSPKSGLRCSPGGDHS